MKNYFAALIKTKYYVPLWTKKKPYLAAHRSRLGGMVLSVNFDKKITNFNVSDFIKTSKKLRSNIVEVQILDIFQYNFVGLCLRHKKDRYLINTSFLIRNTFDRIPYELNACLYSPAIESIHILRYIEKIIRITHSKYYYLRNKPMPESTVPFDYVIDLYDHNVIHAEDATIKEVEKGSLDIRSTL